MNENSPRSGMAIGALVLGILAALFSFLIVGGCFGVVGLLLGLVVIARRQQPRAMAWWGTALSIYGILAAAGFIWLYYLAYKHFDDFATSADSSVSTWEGSPAPDLSVTTLDGDTIRISDLQGKRVVLDFWATWCGPCVKAVPHLNRLHDETSRDELVIIGISDESPDKLRRFVEEHKVRYPIASAPDVPKPYSDINAIPTAFFIDRDGVIQSVVTGYQDFDSLRQRALSPDHAAARPPSRVLAPTELWSKEFRQGMAVAPCDWDGDGNWEVAVVDGARLRILSSAGVEAAAFAIPERIEVIDCIRRVDGVRFLAYRKWGLAVHILDGKGAELLTITPPVAVSAAQWVDLDGDGTEEIIVGMYGGPGVAAYSAEGNELWKGSLGVVWNGDAIDATQDRPALIVAADGNGKMNLFDGAGNLLRTVQPRQKWSAQIAAAAVDGSRRVQAVTIAEDEAVAFDETGTVAWSIKSPGSAACTHLRTFAHGELDGDDGIDWVVRADSLAFMFVTARGEYFSLLKGAQSIHDFAVIPQGDGPDVFVTMEPGMLRAYALR